MSEDTQEENIPISKFARLLFERGISLKDINEATGIAYPTLINLKKGRDIDYRPRTLMDIALYLKCDISDFWDDGGEGEYNTVFEKALKKLSKKHNKSYTLQQVYEITGISLPILTNLRKGKQCNYRKRTIRDICQFLEIKEKKLLDSLCQENELESGDPEIKATKK